MFRIEMSNNGYLRSPPWRTRDATREGGFLKSVADYSPPFSAQHEALHKMKL